MAIKFLGYIDDDEALPANGKRRLLIGCDSQDVASLPTTEGVTIRSGKTAKPDDWSIAIVAGGSTQVLVSGVWKTL